ncbi:MAG: 50S ribosomal protein L11 methyltransferase [Candidatus Aenigmatarchaeota archaeon]
MRIAYDIIGNKEKAVALIGVNVKEPEKVAKEIMKRHRLVKSVLQKLAERKDTFRLYPCKLIAGDENTEVIHKEYGYFLKVDPQKAYFSPRESTERQRIAKMVKPREEVLVMFSGVCPYAIAIAKKQTLISKIYAVEINPNAHKYALENIKLNHLDKKIIPILKDVKDLKEVGKVDRIIMPLVERAIDYLDIAFSHSKKGAIIHLYGLSDGKISLEEKVKEIAKKCNIKYKIIGRQDVLPYAPRIMKVRLDIKVL